jgi:coenzyme PQQ precursor peptide PqqA
MRLVLIMISEEQEIWCQPDFEDLSVGMECTAYAETLD